MKKHDIISIILWILILFVLAYKIGVIQTIILILALIVAAVLYMGLP